MRVAIVAMFGMLASAAAASPDCSNANSVLPAECVAKLDYCRNTSIVLVLAFRERLDGKTEDAALATLSANNTNEAWYANNSQTVKDIVHQIYTKEASFQRLKTHVEPNAGSMALAISQITQGCAADPNVGGEAH